MSSARANVGQLGLAAKDAKTYLFLTPDTFNTYQDKGGSARDLLSEKVLVALWPA